MCVCSFLYTMCVYTHNIIRFSMSEARQKRIVRPQVTLFVDDLGGAFLNCSWTSSTPTHVLDPVVTWYRVAGGSFKPVSDRQTLKVGSDVFAGSTVCNRQSSGKTVIIRVTMWLQ